MSNCKECVHETLCKYNDGVNLWCKNDYVCPRFKDKALNVQLPCKVGDTVYYYSFFSSAIIEGTVQRIIIDKTGVILDTGNRRLNNAEDIGIKFFLTREEAEQALKGV